MSYCTWFTFKMLVLTTSTISVWFTLYLADVSIWSCRCFQGKFCENSIKELLSYCPWFDLWMLVRTTPPAVSVRFTLNLAEVFMRSCRCARFNCRENSIKNSWVIAPDLKCLSGQHLQFQSDSLYSWQKCPFGVVDVQDANFVKSPSRIAELLPLIWLKSACPDNSSYSFCPIHFKLGRSVH